MVYFEDVETTIDVPFEVLEAFMDSDEHGPAHSDDVRNFEVVENTDNVIVLTFERFLDGQWKRSKSRITSFPPYCRFVEELEGQFAGSRFVGIHRPEGTKTRVELFGDVQSQGKGPEETHESWMKMLAKSHAEDMAALKLYLDRK
jgi:hypothetical protein